MWLTVYTPLCLLLEEQSYNLLADKYRDIGVNEHLLSNPNGTSYIAVTSTELLNILDETILCNKHLILYGNIEGKIIILWSVIWYSNQTHFIWKNG